MGIGTAKTLTLVSFEFENEFFGIFIGDSLSIKQNDIHPTDKHLVFVVPDFSSPMDNQLLIVSPYQLIKWKYKIVEESENDEDYVDDEKEGTNDDDDDDDEADDGKEDYE
ncbi:unnamed protein product [Cunninghamella echinulata]